MGRHGCAVLTMLLLMDSLKVQIRHEQRRSACKAAARFMYCPLCDLNWWLSLLIASPQREHALKGETHIHLTIALLCPSLHWHWSMRPLTACNILDKGQQLFIHSTASLLPSLTTVSVA